MPQTILVVPCYNEADRLPAEQFLQYVRDQPETGFLFVNDGSRDGTGDVLRALAARAPEALTVLELSPNMGKAEAVRRGMLAALEGRPSFVGFWDADLATPLQEISRFRRTFDEQPHLWLVMGARVQLLGRKIERKLYRHYAGRVFATLVSWALSLPVYDTQCGAKLVRVQEGLPDLLAQPMFSRWLVDVELLFRLRQLLRDRGGPGLEDVVYELSLLQWRDVGQSKVHFRDFLRSAWHLWRLRRRYA